MVKKKTLIQYNIDNDGEEITESVYRCEHVKYVCMRVWVSGHEKQNQTIKQSKKHKNQE
jgi:hypothetical protein